MAQGLCSAIFVARYRTDADALRERVDRLIEFYEPLNFAGVRLIRLPRLSLAVGEFLFSPPGLPAGGRLPQAAWEDASEAFSVWGGPFPTWLTRAGLLTAKDEPLRDLDRTLAAFAADPSRARLVSGCSGATALFSARSAEIEAWSSHAVAAGFLAHGTVSIDPTTLPEFFAAEFVGAGRTHLRDVHAISAATDIGFTERGSSVRSYWPARERFAVVPERIASAAAEPALLESLESRLATAGDLELGLTAGTDSRVAAIALDRLGVPFQAVTIASGPDAPDARGAAAVAEALGAPHRLYGYELVPDPEAASLINAEVRWAEGLAPLSGLGWSQPGNPSSVVTGGGGETARAWYYRWQALNYRSPRRSQLARVLNHLHWRIAGATSEAHQRVDRAIGMWLDAAEETGHVGWRVLDVVYENERLQRWGRTRLPRVHASFVYAFSSPNLTRALISLPLSDRITDGFHRYFIAKHAPDLALASPPTQRRGIPAVLRRLNAVTRNRRGLDRASGSPWFLTEVWHDRPLNRAFIAESLSREVLRGAMGPAWADRVRTGFLAGEQHATETAFLATSIAALDTALEPLR